MISSVNVCSFTALTNYPHRAGISSTEQIALLRVELDSSKMRLVTNAAFIEAWNNKLPKVSGLEKIIIDQTSVRAHLVRPIEANITGASARCDEASRP